MTEKEKVKDMNHLTNEETDMDRNCFKKGLLLKKKKEEIGKGDSGKEDDSHSAGQLLRILAVEEERVLVIDCMKKTMPVWRKKSELSNYVEVQGEENCMELGFDVLDCYAPKTRKTIYQRFNLISPILPFIGYEAMRSEMITRAAETYSISKQSIRNYLCAYLATQDIRSLAPKEKDAERALTQDEKKMRKALNKYFYTTKKRTLKNVYTLMLRDFFCDAEGKLLGVYPSFYQFRYFYRRYNKKQTELISRNGLSCYQRNQRPLVGGGVQEFAPNVGVGMLDATTLDIYLVNEAGGVVGRPILTACVDAYSGLCCGYNLSWEGGVYSLRNLMLNVIADKVEHCQSFGISLDRGDWPCDKLLGKLVTDMGSEYRGGIFEQITDLGVQIVNLPSYRPELKSKVEKFFDIIQNCYKNQLKGKGVVEPDFQERGAHDYRKDACLTKDEFEKIILHCINFYNTKRVLERFPFTEEMLSLDVKPYANAIWAYGCGQDGCNLIKVDREQLILTLLPRATGRFSRFGLSVHGMHYHNRNFREQYLTGRGDVVVAFNPDDVTRVWLVEDGAFIPFELIESRFHDKSLTDVNDMKQRQRELVRRETENRTQAEIDLANHISVIAGASVGQKKSQTPSLKNIRVNRKREQERNHRNLV